MRILTAMLAILLWLPLAPQGAHARVGFGDPMEVYRNRQSDDDLVYQGYLRLRSAGYQNLNLVSGSTTSPSGQMLWPTGSDNADWTGGADMRMRIGASIFVADDLRFILEVDLLDNMALGSSPEGTPLLGRHGMVAGTSSQNAFSLHDTLRLRVAAAEVLTPLGVLRAGRTTSHFGLGIAANNGADIDDDAGDLADRVAFTAPLFGHFFSMAFDWAASGPTLSPERAATGSPSPHLLSDGLRALSFAWLRYRAPWEVALYRETQRPVVDYGLAITHQWQATDVPAYYDSTETETSDSNNLRIIRGYRAWAIDGWFRLVWGNWRLEAEAIALHFSVDNPSTLAGVALREASKGTPFGATLVLEWTPQESGFSVLSEVGLASADGAYGFPFDGPTSSSGGEAGDYFGTQISGAEDLRVDSFRFHSSYHVDLILWRTLLGGVTEAVFGRTRIKDTFLETFTLEANAIYSHGLSPVSTPGGIGPLGFETDISAILQTGQFSIKLDYGILFPLGGLAIRGTESNEPAQLFMMRLAYEAS